MASSPGQTNQADRERALGSNEPAPQLAYQTNLGRMYQGSIEGLVGSSLGSELKGSAQLVFTSPPFPLKHKKSYGNRTGDDYLQWLEALAEPIADLLTEDGSLVVEIGNAWDAGQPTMSTLPLRALMKLLDAADLHLCQQFVVHNPARLPAPAQWVNIERIRVKDAYTNVWWMSRTTRPKASNRKVLTEYSSDMRRLLDSGKYNTGDRPSGYSMREGTFLADNGGAIPPNVLTIGNTRSDDGYQRYCREHELPPHPARMPAKLVEFFVNFLTDEGDLVIDPFGGSNTTGAVAEELGRRWCVIEPDVAYVEGSRGRFDASAVDAVDAARP